MATVLIRRTCRVTVFDDPRPELRRAGQPYVYAILHCHQVGAVTIAEPGTAAMVSRSGDGDLIVPSLRLAGVIAIRGSSRRKGDDKGGSEALDKLIAHVRGGRPAYLAVDGPRGPRNRVQAGIARLALATGAVVVIAIPVPRRRWILSRTWDRFQIPKLFTHMAIHFGSVLRPHSGEEAESFRLRIETALRQLEEDHDPVEAANVRARAEDLNEARRTASDERPR